MTHIFRLSTKYLKRFRAILYYTNGVARPIELLSCIDLIDTNTQSRPLLFTVPEDIAISRRQPK